MRPISAMLALLSLALLPRLAAGPLDFWTRTLSVTNKGAGTSLGTAAYSNGRWVASFPVLIGTNASFMTYVSDDGQNWIPVREQGIGYLTTGNGLFVGVTGTGSVPVIVSSADGVQWISRRLPLAGYSSPLFYANGLFWCSVASYNSIPQQVILLSSPDALTWTAVSTNAIVGKTSDGQTFGRGITYCHDRFFSLVSGLAPDQVNDVQIFESFDGIDFRPNPRWPLVSQIAYFNGTWVGALTTNASMVTVSANGTDWTNVSPRPWSGVISQLKVVNGRFVFMQEANYFFESQDGMNWVDHEVDLFNTAAWTNLRLYDVVEGPNRLLALASTEAATSTWKNPIFARRAYLSQPLTNAIAPVLGIGRQPALRLESGTVGSGYHIETADAPNATWRRLTTVYPQAFPFAFLAPEGDQANRIYRAVVRD